MKAIEKIKRIKEVQESVIELKEIMTSAAAERKIQDCIKILDSIILKHQKELLSLPTLAVIRTWIQMKIDDFETPQAALDEARMYFELPNGDKDDDIYRIAAEELAMKQIRESASDETY